MTGMGDGNERDTRSAAHVHEWEPCGTVDHETFLSSPVSRMDDVIVVQKMAVRSCKCGAVRRTEVGRTERWAHRSGRPPAGFIL